ncbi:MAG: alpha/beta hydrolase [Lunatimonas sp.]|uniref:alpha/beta fold hydrolase n=1 Tax=Lunatimonas sp. TaxID=2060141 RepID=UPI00263B4F1E|nr:alpha/beta hydrolase [Lunatimonas sp.]MCC5938465.1 alpha/beta hydrolase [Lunatimonas sp.]
MPTVNANGIDIYYETRGSGEPLLLIMGITAPGSVWEKHTAAWEKDFTCILMDNRGVGRSSKPVGPYSTALMADDCAALLEALGISQARVAGVSMGSTIAQQLAIRHPHKVRSMVLMCPWARCDNKAKAIFELMVDCKARFRPQEFSRFIQQLIFSKASWDDPGTFQAMLEDREGAANDSNPQPLLGLEGQAAACIEHDVLKQLGHVQIPTFVVGGEADEFTPKWMTEEVAKAIPGADLHIYPNSGHAFHWENLEDFNQRVGQWLLQN